MPPKRNQHRKNNKPSGAAVVSAMANCVFPEDILVSILTRLPVKSIVRFKSVCKPWYKLFATPKFIKFHHAQFSKNTENQSVIIYSLSDYHDHTMSLFKLSSTQKKTINLDHPFPEVLFRMDFVGSYNGLLCMGCPPLGHGIVLWNPAMKLFKFVRVSKEELGVPEKSSLGFGYDSIGDDFKVVRIVSLAKKVKKMSVAVEVYSANSDSWKTIKKLGVQFADVLGTKNDVIVNGNPYWVAKVDETGESEVLVRFDVRKMAFEIVPLSSFNLSQETIVPLVDWKGSLGALVCNKNDERVDSVDVWVFDEGGERVWSKKHTFGRIELKVYRLLQCSEKGKILGECVDGELFVFDPENGFVKKIVIDEASKGSFVIHGYTESLAFVEGMKEVEVKKLEEEELEDDKTEAPVVDVESFIRSLMELNGW